MELKLFGLLSFGFSFGTWFGREMEWENCFLVMLCNQKEVVFDVCCDKKNGVKNARIFV